MRRLLIVVFCLVLAGAVAVGCSKINNLQQLKNAMAATGEIPRANVLTTFHYQMDFSGLNLDLDERRELETYRDFRGTFAQRFDREKGLSYIDGHLDIGGMGFDLKAYSDQNRLILLLPTFPKFLVLDRDELEREAPVPAGTTIDVQKPEWTEQFAELWFSLLRAERVYRTGSQIITTPEGDLKTTGYEITLEDAEIRDLSRQALQIVFGDPEIREQIIVNWLKYVRKEKLTRDEVEVRLNEILDLALDGIEQTRFDHFRYTGAIDRDGYLTRETISSSVSVQTDAEWDVSSKLDIQIERWSIGRPVRIDLPELTSENSFSLPELEENMPRVFESLFEEARS